MTPGCGEKPSTAKRVIQKKNAGEPWTGGIVIKKCSLGGGDATGNLWLERGFLCRDGGGCPIGEKFLKTRKRLQKGLIGSGFSR